MRDGGKGDRKRPLVIPKEQFNKNWDAIFKKKTVNFNDVLNIRLAQALGEELFNGMTEEETNETASVKGLNK